MTGKVPSTIASTYDAKPSGDGINDAATEAPQVLKPIGVDISPPVALPCELGLTRLLSWVIRVELERLEKAGITYADATAVDSHGWNAAVDPAQRPWWMRPERCSVEKFVGRDKVHIILHICLYIRAQHFIARRNAFERKPIIMPKRK